MVQRIQGGTFWAGALAALILWAQPVSSQGNLDCLSFTRQYTPAVYVPGNNVTVTVSFTENCTDIIAALGLVETLPPGWFFVSAAGPTPPDTRPDAGDTDPLEFSWISSQPPFSFSYVIRAPQGETGDKLLTGTAEYRVGTGSAQFAGPVETLLDDGIVQCVDQPGCVTVQRSTGNGLYPPGAALQVTVSITENCQSPLQELTIAEEIPTGWTFASVSGTQPPTIQPAPGEGGTVEFGWTTAPPLPTTFTYSLAVPASSTGVRQINGTVTWRTCDDNLSGTIPTSTLNPGESPLENCIAQCGTSALDSDGDRLNDCVEDCLGTEADDPDTDKDGIPDGVEAFAGLNPIDVTDARQDLDRDGDDNLREFLSGSDMEDASDPAPVFYLSPNGADDPAGGDFGAPWQSIPYALAQIDAKGAVSARLLLAPGLYEGDVTLRENVSIIGLGPCGETLAGCSAIVGQVQGANGAALRNVVLAVDDAFPEATLLTLDNVAMDLEDVDFVGTPDYLNTGILIIGDEPGQGNINACRFEQLGIGIVVRGCHPRVFGSTFLDHSGAYIVFEDVGTPPCGGSLGQAGNANTGWNRFDEGMGLSIINENDEVIVMERNDWDTNDAEFIAARIDGPIDFEPFLAAGSNLLAASFFATVTNSANNAPVEDATVSLGVGNINPVTTNKDGVYSFAVIPEGSYTVTASAPGFQTESMPIFIERGGVFSGIFTLEADALPEGEPEGGDEGEEGEGEGDPNPGPGGCQCPEPGKAVPTVPDAGNLLVGMLSVLALALYAGLQRRTV